MPLPFIAGLFIGAGAIAIYNNREKVAKFAKEGLKTAKKEGEKVIDKVKDKVKKDDETPKKRKPRAKKEVATQTEPKRKYTRKPKTAENSVE